MKIGNAASERLRNADELDIVLAMEGASFGSWPQDEAALLEFFNRMIDLKLGDGADEGQ
ncbi:MULTISPECIES: hypothetical protein [unclassified Novosphingobium]|uniref:hypothetical protein n=1 Tax=unclassified Novosphingobium TaxID=2644732 RepID=UPI0013590792|nr:MULTISPECIES: hypothetical protein [unclassified Novosphingobium]